MDSAVVDEHCQTDVQGLYAAGEVCASVHGAKGLGDNSTPDVFFFGSITAENVDREAVAFGDHPLSWVHLLTEVAKLQELACYPGKRGLSICSNP